MVVVNRVIERSLKMLGAFCGAPLVDKALVLYLEGRRGNLDSHRLNGEAWLIKAVACDGGRVFFDVGANRGEWSAIALSCAPKGEVHAFEPNPALRPLLNQRFHHCPGVVINSVALGDAGRQTVLKVFNNDGCSTVVEGFDMHDCIGFSEVMVSVLRLDDYVNVNGISQIDLLKLDVEGAESLVLNGASSLLGQQRIRVVQFEYGYANAHTRFLMRDFYDLFSGHGYVVGRLCRNRVDFRDYDIRMNNFETGPNYVAIRKGDLELRRVLM